MSFITDDKVEIKVDKIQGCEDCLNNPFKHNYQRFSRLELCKKHTEEFMEVFYRRRCQKEYYYRNKEAIAERQKKRYQEKKDIIVKCECGEEITYGNKSSHKYTIRHRNYLQQIKTNSK